MNNILKSKNLDGAVITSPENMRYLSGFTGGEGFLLLTPDNNYIFIDGRYTVQAKEQAKGFIVTEYSSNPFELLKEFNLKRIGFEDINILHSTYLKLPECEKIGISGDLIKLRCVKNDDEIEKMKKAAEIADNAFSYILNVIREGMTEKEIAAELDYYMKKNGADGNSFDTIVAFEENSALPHAQPTDRKLKNGETVLMDYGCKYDGYCSDMTRTVALGTIKDELKKIYDTVLKAQLAAEDALKAGMKCCDIDKIARDIIENAGYKNCFNHSLGHGVGLEIHETPNLSPKSNAILKPNNVVTVEPGIYIEGLGGVRIEDMVYITENGYVNFTHSPKELIIL